MNLFGVTNLWATSLLCLEFRVIEMRELMREHLSLQRDPVDVDRLIGPNCNSFQLARSAFVQHGLPCLTKGKQGENLHISGGWRHIRASYFMLAHSTQD